MVSLGKISSEEPTEFLIQFNIIECHNVNSNMKYEPYARVEKCALGFCFHAIVCLCLHLLSSCSFFPLSVNMPESVS